MKNDKFLINKQDSTIVRFIDSYDYFDIDELKTLIKVFPMLKDHEMIEANYVDNGRIRLGIRIRPQQKKMTARNQVEIVNKIQTYEDDKDLYFFKALYEFTSVSAYLNANDRISLSNLLDDFSLGQGIGELKEASGNIIIPICCNTKAKQMIKK